MFYFKQFSVEDSSSPMKVGTDGVLLGAWCPTKENVSILDIGTGCGVISLMLAQRINNATIKAIDIDKGAIENAKQNFELSKWNNKLTAIECPIQLFSQITSEKFDIIVSNPPFFVESLKSNKNHRNLARHTDSLPFETLIENVSYLIKDDGIFACILPYNEGYRFIDIANKHNLFCSNIIHIANKPSHTVKRILFVLSKTENYTMESPTLFIRNEDNTYSNEYLQLTKDFYTFI